MSGTRRRTDDVVRNHAPAQASTRHDKESANETDRQAGCLRARCAWKAKDPSQMGAEPSTYVKEA